MRKPGDLAARLGVAALGIPVIGAALYLGGWTLGGLLALAGILGAREFYGMSRLQGSQPFSVLGQAAVAILILATTATPTFAGLAAASLVVLLALAGAVLALSLVLRWPGGSPAGALGSTLAGAVYVGVPLAFVPLLRALPEPVPAQAGLWAPMAFVLLPLLATWAGDTSAYFVGSAVGRTKLAPTLSPGKTVEGAMGGVAGSVAAAATVAHWLLADLPDRAVPVASAAWIGAFLAVGTQVGDLVESALKRESGVKDSGRLLPGHGGMLDRLDALLFAFPISWFLLTWIGVTS